MARENSERREKAESSGSENGASTPPEPEAAEVSTSFRIKNHMFKEAAPERPTRRTRNVKPIRFREEDPES